MNKFAVAQVRNFPQAAEILNDHRFNQVVVKAGGIDLLDHLKEGLREPDLLINLRSLDEASNGEKISKGDESLHLHATTTLSELARSSHMKVDAPVLAEAAGEAALPHIRNVATIAGNLLQRPRCWYYRNQQFDCLKKGGYQCFAVKGEHQYHAVFGDGPCHIVHPSNIAVALYVLDAMVHVIGGDRDTIPIAELFHTPDRGMYDEHNLQPGEIVTHITCQAAPRSAFYAAKEKQASDWPLVMAAATLNLENDQITAARLCAGAVAPVPWPLPEVERGLVGLNIHDRAGVRKVCELSVRRASPLPDNAYKLKLLPVVIHRALLKAAGLAQEIYS